MRKFFTFLFAAATAFTVSAQNEKVLFDNPDAAELSWSEVCKLSAADMADLKAGDIFEVTVSAINADNQWPKFGFDCGDDAKNIYPSAFEMWDHRAEVPYVAKYTVTEDAAASLMTGDYAIKGDGVTVTKVVLVAGEELPAGETLIFDNPNATELSWNELCKLTAAQMANIKEGDTFEVTVTGINSATQYPKFGFDGGTPSIYPSAFEMWEHREQLPYVAKYTVTADVAEALKTGDYAIKGDGVTITRVVLVAGEQLPEGQTLIFNNPDAAYLSWSTLCSVTAAQVKGIKAGDYFIITVDGRSATCDWPKFGFEQGSTKVYPSEFEMWDVDGVAKTFPCEVNYYVSADDVAWMKEGFDIKGDGVKITRVVFVVADENADTETVLWKGDSTEMGWGAGPTVPAGKASVIKVGDKIGITVDQIVTGANKWPKVVCRCEDGWDEIFAVNLFEEPYASAEYPTVVEVEVTEAMLPMLAKGFNFGGENAFISKVVRIAGETNGIEDITDAAEEPAVVNVYSITGVCVRYNVNLSEATAGLPAGLYIVNGKKYIVR